jgi:hypothetical protein
MATDKEIIQICADRLKGNGAWQGNGLLVFLATTSRKDREREWMEPLKALCESVVYAAEDNEPMPELTDDDLQTINELLSYSVQFHANLEDGLKTEASLAPVDEE